jgi:hypothetical protein
MSQAPAEPTDQRPRDDGLMVKSTFGLGNILAMIVVCALVVGFGCVVWQLRPKVMPTGRPIGAVGQIQTFAVPVSPNGEGFTIWRNGRQIGALPQAIASTFQRIELSSNDVDVAGSPEPDLVLYAWTGGAHCCFTQILIDGHNGKLLGQFDLGNGDPMPFVPAKATGLARAVAVNYDDVSAFKFGSYADSPMARILVVWDGKRFGLDTKRMKSTTAESPPSYFIAEPELGDAVPLRVQDFGESEDVPAPGTDPAAKGGERGDRAKAYQSWMEGEEARMASTALNVQDTASFGPMAAFLNERIYKGHAKEGVATVVAAYASNPGARDAALAHYFSVLGESRWLGDLNKLNDSQLTGLITTLTTPLPSPRASP